MIGFILDFHTWAVKSIFQFSQYSLSLDYAHKNQSTIVIHDLPTASKGDWVIAYDYALPSNLVDSATNNLTDLLSNQLVVDNNASPLIFGIFKETKSTSEHVYQIVLTSPLMMFDRNVYYTSGSEKINVEKALKDVINENWVNVADTYISVPYMVVRTYTSTGLLNEFSSSNGILNVLTAINSAFAEKNIRIRFTPTKTSLYVDIYRDESFIKLSTDLPDVVSYTETENNDILAKLNVKWKFNNGTGYIGTYSYFSFYALSDGTVSTNPADPNRIEGKIDSVYITADTYAEAVEKAIEKFSSSKRQHKLVLRVLSEGCYELKDYYEGKTVKVWIDGREIDSYITQLDYSSESYTIDVTLGDLPVTLTDKLRTNA